MGWRWDGKCTLEQSWQVMGANGVGVFPDLPFQGRSEWDRNQRSLGVTEETCTRMGELALILRSVTARSST